jgi:LPS export ABC transporter protein LptC
MGQFKKNTEHRTIRVLGLIMLLAFTAGCGGGETKEIIEYKGPLSEIENVELFYSENDRVKVKMTADLMYEFENGDREFPKGVFMEFFDEFGTMEHTLRANHAFFFSKEDHWRGRGNVEVKNIAKANQLNTEELFWRRKDKKIFTEKFVTIRQEGDVLYGQGLIANEDLSEYTITKPSGDMEIEE